MSKPAVPFPPEDELHSNAWAKDIFKGKVVFCTGGAGTICSGQVRALVSLGANAAILGRREANTQSVAAEIAKVRPGSKVLGFGCDVRDHSSLVKAVESTVKELGRIDFLICGAAGNFLSTVDGLSPNAFKTVMDIDLLGSFNTVKACLPELKKTKGRIIFVSASFHYTGAALQSHVAAAKAGIDALSHSLSIELGPAGITSNVVTPGAIAKTEGMDRLTATNMVPEELRENPAKMTPLGRWGAISEVADATIFLFSDAGRYINGVTIVVDGGSWRNGNQVASFLYPMLFQPGAEKNFDFMTAKGGKKQKESKL
ncbi:hypothetical protein TWF694_002641 [Orbilia ellipsospora]|uniref:2,4-dienoyl-CoA reductase [(3E)-enoyl-CoA-producing] n=1 Tax=Orbilia ellipsospora TaxID=2528407 RepID=A0AAV9X8P3_9PEZI